MSEINMNQFERMVKWGAQPLRLAESFGITEARARKLVKAMGVETAQNKLVRENNEKAEQARKLIEQGGMTLMEASKTLGVRQQALVSRGIRSSRTILERNEVSSARNRIQEEPPTYANGRLRTLGI